MKNRLALIVLLASFVVWVPGISQPMLTLNGTVDKADLIALGKDMVANSPGVLPFLAGMVSSLLDNLEVEGDIQAYEKTRSILGTARELFDSGNYVVGFLIMLFSVIIPVTKGLLLLGSALIKELGIKGHSYDIANLISKWSMADVFVVAIVVAYLAANATRDMGEIFTLQARFEPGFYFFLGYCVLSILSAQLMRAPFRVAQESASPQHYTQ
jgi:hypothetical protein